MFVRELPRFHNDLVSTAALLLLMLLVGWMRDFTTWQPLLEVISALAIYEHLVDFTKGILDTQHVVYYLSLITFGLFLTTRSVDGERWRG